jgi:hypothetical protein
MVGNPESVQPKLFDLQDELCESGQVTSRTIDDPEADRRTPGLDPRMRDRVSVLLGVVRQGISGR